jgi:hypothetical protein
LRGASEICALFRKLECGAGRFNEGTSGIGKFHGPSRIAIEELELLLFFEVGKLFAEGRLGDVQPVRGPSKVELFRQGNDRVQVTYIDARKQGSTPGIRVQ